MIRCHLSVSLDGFAAGPDQSLDEPLGRGGERLHDWAFATRAFQEQHGREGAGEAGPDDDVVRRVVEGVGAYVMGRGMFGGEPGGWDPSWEGWWGAEPPFHAPVFVLTHHAREPLALTGTTFTFVTGGIAEAVERARDAAAGQDVMVAGGASTVNQALRAGLLDELLLHVVPVCLGGGARLLEDVGDPRLEPVEVVASPGVTHVRYRLT